MYKVLPNLILLRESGGISLKYVPRYLSMRGQTIMILQC